jgi:hypothetical protein
MKIVLIFGHAEESSAFYKKRAKIFDLRRRRCAGSGGHRWGGAPVPAPHVKKRCFLSMRI